MAAKRGILLMNLGSPADLSVRSIRRFLRDFLSDPLVVQLRRVCWLPILYGAILPWRPKKLLPAYAEIWFPEGSPLIVYCQQLRQKLQEKLPEHVIHCAMRYGQPGVKEALAAFAEVGVTDIKLLSLYPQYSVTTTQTNIEYVQRLAQPGQQIQAVQDYHDHPAYIAALAGQIKTHWQENTRAECLLFSFHGLPEKSIQQGDPYYAQCLQTAALIVKALGLTDKQYRISFQSRVGRARWLSPYTDETVTELAQQGVGSLDVICPGFSVDCLETLEEIAMQNRDIFLENGGETFHYIPALNADDQHVEMLATIALNGA